MSDPAGRASNHQALRELLGSYAMGHLDQAQAAAVAAHLEQCADCRRDLAEIEPMVARLAAIDPTRFADPAPAPDPELAGRIRTAIGEERRAREEQAVRSLDDVRRARTGPWRRPGLAAAAVALVVGAAVGGGLVGRATAPEPEGAPLEPVSMAAEGSADVEVDRADLVAHTWGVELRMEARGFAEGRTFTAAFRTEEGELVPAGEFRGVGEAPMECFLQSSVLREDVTEVLVTDQRGRTVLAADL